MKIQTKDTFSVLPQQNANIVLVTGGARSGKSAYAEKLALSWPGPKLFIATCPVIDEEMAERIARHKRDRQGKGWSTIEEPLDLARAISAADESALILVDCLTLWINNLLYEAEKLGTLLTEDDISIKAQELIQACSGRLRTIIFVTNEVGLGLVPDTSASRRYRDLLGRLNQEVAARADEVVLLVAGIPLCLKSGGCR